MTIDTVAESSSASNTHKSLLIALPDSQAIQSRVCFNFSALGPSITKMAFDCAMSAAICAAVLLPLPMASISSYFAWTLVDAKAWFRKLFCFVSLELWETNISATLDSKCQRKHMVDTLNPQPA